ncbi:MAG: PTS sugar transporter subunit IIA [Verrucomicrobiota bacterium]
MTLAHLLSVDQIIPEMQAKERWAAIAELADQLVHTQLIALDHRQEILEALEAREHTMSTGIGLGIAIPHASSDRVSKVVVAFGRSKDGIDFGALDHAPVRFVVLFVVPKDEFQMHLRTLAAIAKFLNDKGIRERIAAASNQEEILNTFRAAGR